MVQLAAEAEKDIQGLLRQVVTHRMKIQLAAPVDQKYGTRFQRHVEHWNKEIAKWREQLARENQTHLRKRGQFFTDEQLLWWEEDQALVEQAMERVTAKYVEFLEEQNIKPDKRWLRTTLMRLWYE
jgi:hypothetical protein